MPASPFTFYAYDLVARTFRAELPFSSFSFTEVRDRPGSFDAVIAVDHPKATRATLDPGATAIFVDHLGALIYGGILWTANARVPETGEATLRLAGQGFFSAYRDGRRSIRSRSGMTYATGANGFEVIFTAVDAFRIVKDIIDHGATFPGDVGFDAVRFNGPGAATAFGNLAGSLMATTFYTYELKDIGDAIEELAAQSPGFDFAVSVAWNGSAPARYLDLYYPRQGRVLDLRLEVGKNVTLVDWTIDATKAANVAVATGAGTGDALKIAETFAPELISPAGPYPRLEAIRSYRDESLDAALLAHANADLSLLKMPPEPLTLDVITGRDLDLGSFTVGDTVHVIANRGFLDVDENQRIEARTVTINDRGKATIRVSMADEAATLGTA